MYSKTVEMPMVNGVRVVVPDNIHLVTPYVLYEQQDWFEDEIKFLREIILPGQHVIDIGANFGVYALSLAKSVGPSGSVRAFEPTPSTAALLEASVALNGFAQVQVSRTALSHYSGTANIAIAASPEMNALLDSNEVSDLPLETVQVESLDALNATGALNNVSFIKIDAEGHEANILEGGKAFFKTTSPLVMFEIIHSGGARLDLVEKLSSMGFASYRLIPGLNVLIPFSAEEPVPPFLLNLFACKADTAKVLVERGCLATQAALDCAEVELNTAETQQRLRQSDEWRQYLKRFPYAQFLNDSWSSGVSGIVATQTSSLNLAMALFMLSEDKKQSAAHRYLALLKSRNAFMGLVDTQPEALHLSSLARVHGALGERVPAVATLSLLFNKIHAEKRIDANVPFLAATKDFALKAFGDRFSAWLVASIIATNERLQQFSSFYAGQEALQWLKTLHSSGMADDETIRRLNLLSERLEV